jgi:hypothetical protein
MRETETESDEGHAGLRLGFLLLILLLLTSPVLRS